MILSPGFKKKKTQIKVLFDEHAAGGADVVNSSLTKKLDTRSMKAIKKISP